MPSTSTEIEVSSDAVGVAPFFVTAFTVVPLPFLKLTVSFGVTFSVLVNGLPLASRVFLPFCLIAKPTSLLFNTFSILLLISFAIFCLSASVKPPLIVTVLLSLSKLTVTPFSPLNVTLSSLIGFSFVPSEIVHARLSRFVTFVVISPNLALIFLISPSFLVTRPSRFLISSSFLVTRVSSADVIP